MGVQQHTGGGAGVRRWQVAPKECHWRTGWYQLEAGDICRGTGTPLMTIVEGGEGRKAPLVIPE